MFYYYSQSYKKMFNFHGRATRTEYWSCFFTSLLIHIIFWVVAFAIGLGTLLRAANEDIRAAFGVVKFVLWFFCYLFWLASRIIPSISVTVRRIQDVGYPGWLYVLQYIFPVVGTLAIFILMLVDGQESKNQYGENPRKRKKKKHYQRKSYRSIVKK